MRYETNVLIDYYKIILKAEMFTPIDVKYNPLIDALGLNDFSSDKTSGIKNYREGYIFDNSTYIFCNTLSSLTKEGEQTTVLELKGSGCRDMEVRWFGENLSITPRLDLWEKWGQVLIETMSFDINPSRLDLTIDWHKCPYIDEIVYKLSHREWIGSFRRTRQSGGPIINATEEDLRDDRFKKFDNGGFSCLLGSNNTIQLEIYNKSKELEKKGIIPVDDETIRFEMRFFGETLRVLMPQLLESMFNNTIDELAFSLLSGMFELKDKHNFDNRNRNKAPTWLPWLDFISNAEAMKVVPPTTVPLSLMERFAWFKKSCSATLMQMYLADPDLFLSLISKMMSEKVDDLSNGDLSSINKVRRHFHLNQLTDVDVKKKVRDFAWKNNYSGDSLFLDSVIGNKKVKDDEDEK